MTIIESVIQFVFYSGVVVVVDARSDDHVSLISRENRLTKKILLTIPIDKVPSFFEVFRRAESCSYRKASRNVRHCFNCLSSFDTAVSPEKEGEKQKLL